VFGVVNLNLVPSSSDPFHKRVRMASFPKGVIYPVIVVKVTISSIMSVRHSKDSLELILNSALIHNDN